MGPSDKQLEGTMERIVRLETKLDFLIAHLERLPPSPICIENHREVDKRLLSLEAWRNRAIGALLIVNIVFIIVIEKITNILGIK